jgi:hypothetical protein
MCDRLIPCDVGVDAHSACLLKTVHLDHETRPTPAPAERLAGRFRPLHNHSLTAKEINETIDLYMLSGRF